jgi:hypothetical protein
MNFLKITALLFIAAITGCATTSTVDNCSTNLTAPLRSAMTEVEDKLLGNCAGDYQTYVADLIDIAVDNPDAANKRAFSDFLVRLSDRGIISKRQASALYNRYFNVKFVSLDGDYSTCSQVCPVKDKVILDMRQELLDKEIGLLQISNDKTGYYRADLLLKESELVLQATCQACSAGRS